jgi:hypothetical protein
MNLDSLTHLSPRERLAAIEAQTTLKERQALDLDDRQRLAIAVAGCHLDMLGVMMVADPLDLARRAIERDEQAAAVSETDWPRLTMERDLQTEHFFRGRRRGG